MVSSSDFICLPFTPDLNPVGIAIASRRLATSSLTGEPRRVDDLRSDVAQACVELAFRRYLLEERIPFKLEESHPLTEPDQVTIVLGGRRLLIATSLVGETLIDSEQLINSSIRLPSRFLPAESLSGNDLAIFAFVRARIHSRQDELHQADRCHHTMPAAWRRIRPGKAQGRLSILSAAASPLTIDVYGLDLQQKLCMERISLDPQKWVITESEYLSLSCLQSSAIPAARVEVRSPAHRTPYTIMPLQWRNVWVYGEEIRLAGYLPLEQIWSLPQVARQRVTRHSVKTDLRVADLHPLGLFLEQVARLRK